MEGRELDAVAVYFADVEVSTDREDMLLGDVVCGAPDLLGGFMLAGFVRLVWWWGWGGRVERNSRDRLEFASVLCR
jgi:hypothetical protein